MDPSKVKTITIKSNFSSNDANFLNLEEELKKLNLTNVPPPVAEISYEPIPDSAVIKTKSLNIPTFGFSEQELFNTDNKNIKTIETKLKNENHGGREEEIKEEKRKLFIGSINTNTTSEEIYNHFIKYGEIERINLNYDFNTNNIQGYAYVIFKNNNVIENVLKSGDVFNIDKRKIKAKRKFSNISNQNINIENIQQIDKNIINNKLSNQYITANSENPQFKFNSKTDCQNINQQHNNKYIFNPCISTNNQQNCQCNSSHEQNINDFKFSQHSFNPDNVINQNKTLSNETNLNSTNKTYDVKNTTKSINNENNSKDISKCCNGNVNAIIVQNIPNVTDSIEIIDKNISKKNEISKNLGKLLNKNRSNVIEITNQCVDKDSENLNAQNKDLKKEINIENICKELSLSNEITIMTCDTKGIDDKMKENEGNNDNKKNNRKRNKNKRK